MKLAVVIGRFQPLHAGHLALINEAIQKADRVLVLVGSAIQLPDYRNPFSYADRVEFLRDSYDYDISIRPLPDKPTDDEWITDVVGHILSIEEDPTEVAIFCHPKDEQFYRESFVYPVFTREEHSICATEIRHAWYTDSQWTTEAYVSDFVKDFMLNYEDKERLANEYVVTRANSMAKLEGHPFGNPIEPVSFALIVKGPKVLVGKRGGARGYGQLGLPGGYIQNTETSLEGCIREVKEELGVDLESLIVEHKACCLVQAVEENVNDLGTRTIGINYMFVIQDDVDLEVTIDNEETLDFQWVPLSEILEDSTLLFFNHNLVVKRLVSKFGGSKHA